MSSIHYRLQKPTHLALCGRHYRHDPKISIWFANCSPECSSDYRFARTVLETCSWWQTEQQVQYRKILPSTSTVQLSSALSKHPQQIKKRLCLFLPGWLACTKKSLDSILQKNLSCLFCNKKFKDMFLDYDICIVFKNDGSTKTWLLKPSCNLLDLFIYLFWTVLFYSCFQ